MTTTATETVRTFSESELAVLVADGIKRETASLTAERDKATTALAETQNKLDAAIVAQKAAEDAKVAAETKAAELATATEKAAEQAAKKDERIGKMREVAKHCEETFFTDADRVARVTAMDDTAFQGYLDDLKVSAGNATAPGTPSTPPRETAMVGDKPTPTGGAGTASASGAFLGRRFGAEPAKS